LFDKQPAGYGGKSLGELTPDDWRVRLGGDHKIKEVVMAKVIEFYVQKNFRRPLKWAGGCQIRVQHLAERETEGSSARVRLRQPLRGVRIS
jgi:hypothetical protein